MDKINIRQNCLPENDFDNLTHQNHLLLVVLLARPVSQRQFRRRLAQSWWRPNALVQAWCHLPDVRRIVAQFRWHRTQIGWLRLEERRPSARRALTVGTVLWPECVDTSACNIQSYSNWNNFVYLFLWKSDRFQNFRINQEQIHQLTFHHRSLFRREMIHQRLERVCSIVQTRASFVLMKNKHAGWKRCREVLEYQNFICEWAR